jgi:hypothetical protein
VAKLTDPAALVAARCVAPGWIRWAQSTRDGRVHAFLIQDSQPGRWLRAMCAHTIPPAALCPATVVGIRCARCALAVTAARTAQLGRQGAPGSEPGCWAGCLATTPTPSPHHWLRCPLSGARSPRCTPHRVIATPQTWRDRVLPRTVGWSRRAQCTTARRWRDECQQRSPPARGR